MRRARGRIRFSEYAASLFERKVTKGRSSRRRRGRSGSLMLRLHLLPAFGDVFLDGDSTSGRRGVAEAMGKTVRCGRVFAGDGEQLARHSCGGSCTSAVAEHELRRNPIAGDRGHRHQHALHLQRGGAELAAGRGGAAVPRRRSDASIRSTSGWWRSDSRPACGRRASGRCVGRDRRRTCCWEEGVVLVRRSHTRHDEVMEATKQKTRYRITLARRPDGNPAGGTSIDCRRGRCATRSLLFPSETGGFRSASALDKPFREVGEAIKLRKRITPRAMRRTFQDLARNADIETIVRQKICGHATQEMSDLYSTVPQKEIQAAVGAVISLAKYRELLRDGASWWESGGKGGKSETATRESVPSGRFSVGVEGIEPSASTV